MDGHSNNPLQKGEGYCPGFSVKTTQPFINAFNTFSYSSYACRPKRTKRTSLRSVFAFRYSKTVFIATFAASERGYPYAPVLMDGNAILFNPLDDANFRLSLYALARSSASFFLPPQNGRANTNSCVSHTRLSSQQPSIYRFQAVH